MSTVHLPVAPARLRRSLGFIVNTLLFLVFFTLPVYVLPSGSVQIVDFFIISLICCMVFRRDTLNMYFIKQISYFTPFALWVILVNLMYFSVNYDDYQFLKKAAEILYLFLLTYIFFRIFNEAIYKNAFTSIYIGILFSLMAILIFEGNHDATEIRLALSFNNPNQMGYFSVLLMSFVILLKNVEILHVPLKYKKINRAFIVLIIIACHVLPLLAVSKASLCAILLLDLFLVKDIPIKQLATVLVLFIIVMATLVSYKPVFFDKLQYYLVRRSQLDNVISRFDDNADRLVFPSDWQIFVGVGAGKSERNVDELEVHNIWGAILKSYGIIGLILSAIWFIRLFWLSRIINGGLFVFGAIAFYNIFHNGIRFRLFWITTALLIIISSIIDYKNNSRSSKIIIN